jgi:potassium-transporting ATPase ATP-binding subunit
MSMTTQTKGISMLDRSIVVPAIGDSFRKLDPRTLARNPVMFAVEVVAAAATILFVRDLFVGAGEAVFTGQITIWLWFTVLFANVAEAVAEGRGKAQANTLRKMRSDTVAKVLVQPESDSTIHEKVRASNLQAGQVVLVETGDLIPGDGEVVEGVATVNEAAITGAQRQKTPNEIALNILLAGMTLIFLFAVVTIPSFAIYAGGAISGVVLIALFVTLIPTTIGALLSAIGIAGMDRLVKFNVLAMSGRAVEASGDVDVLLLDKTGTITLGNRQAAEFLPVPGVTDRELADAAQLASLSDDTPEGRSVVVLAKQKFGLRGRDMAPLQAHFVPFTAQTRMSGIDVAGSSIRKGAVDSILEHVQQAGGRAPAGMAELRAIAERVAKGGGTPLAVVKDGRLLGIIHLKDIVKGGIRERFAELRRMGMRTVMVTGDNPQTAAAIAAEAGVDDFLAQATPEAKLKLIRAEQSNGKLVAMCGDGTNDAPALAQADVGVAMHAGTQAAREAGNMVDLDSDPTKLIEIVAIGKQLLITRGALTTFSIANDVAKYFAIIPAMFAAFYPQLGVLNVMGLSTPESAILSAIIFNALIIIALIPLALKGVKYRPVGAASILRRNILVYGIGGIIIPFIGIKAVDIVVSALGLA